MSCTLSVPLLLLCFQASRGPGNQFDGSRFGHDPRLAAGEQLLAYRWDEGATVPYLGLDDEPWIEFGERGLRPSARLYLPGHALNEGVFTGASEAASVELALAEGRYGQGIAFGPRSYVRFYLPPQEPWEHGWTISFWIRPEPAAFGRPLCVLPGAVDIALQSDGRVRASLLPAGELLTHDDPLRAGTWSFVLVAYDPLVTRKFQLFVDGTSAGVRLAAPVPPRIASELIAGDLGRIGDGFTGVVDELSVEGLSTSTARAQRMFRNPPEAGVHQLDLVTTAGLRTVAPSAGATTDLVLETNAQFELGMLDGVAVQGGSLRWVPARWREVEPETGVPPARTTHPLVSLGGGRVFTFGGETRDTHLGPMGNSDDTWIYDGPTRRWEQVFSATAPDPRCHVPAAYSPDHDLVLLVGGWRNELVPSLTFGDTWVFHVSERRWEQRYPSGVPLGQRSDHGLVYLPTLRRFLLMHGQQNRLYDPIADTWDLLPFAQAQDESGHPTWFALGGSPTCALDPITGMVVVFSGSYGSSQSVFPDTTALYDVSMNTYTVLAPPVRPSGRVRSGFAYDPEHDVFALFGGVRDQFSERNDDLWIFDPRQRVWTEIQCSNRPSRRGGYYGMAYDDVGERFVLYGGRHDPTLWLDETWTLELDWSRSGTGLFTFDRAKGLYRNDWFADVTTPGDSTVSFLFRSSRTGATWSDWSASTASAAGRRYFQVMAFLVPGTFGETPSIQRMGLR